MLLIDYTHSSFNVHSIRKTSYILKLYLFSCGKRISKNYVGIKYL